MVAEQQLAEQPKKRKKRPRVKYLDMEVPAAEGERRAALQKIYERERCLFLIQSIFSFDCPQLISLLHQFLSC